MSAESVESVESVEEAEAPETLAPAKRRAEVFDALAVLVALLLLLAVFSGAIASVRLILTLLFTFFVPGRAVISNWPRMSRWAPEAMSMVFSLAILTFLATVTLWARFWHPIPLFAAEAVLSLIGLAISIVRRRGADPSVQKVLNQLRGLTRVKPKTGRAAHAKR
jgi:uncharacterized membrane protein